MREVGTAEYGAAVIELVKVAQQFGSGPAMAAQVLLSCYDGANYQTNLSNFGSFDRKNYALAMTVIIGRHDTGHEPHSMVMNGNEVFAALKEKWSGFHVRNRGKVMCPACDGRGRIFLSRDDDDGKPCTRCDETGRVCGCKA